MDRTARIRQVWEFLETLHVVTYFVKECRDAFKSLGVTDSWSRYFAGRAAPLGRVTPATVAAVFYGFAEPLVTQHLPQAFDVASPDAFYRARIVGATAALTRLTGGHDLHAANAALAPVVESLAHLPASGAPLFAANRAQGLSDAPIARIFEVATLVREWRGDRHNAILAAHDITGCQAHVLMCAIGAETIEVGRDGRGWSAADWEAGLAALSARGLVHPDGTITPPGRAERATIERATDAQTLPLFANVDDAGLDQLLGTLEPLAAAVRESGELPAMPRAAHLLDLDA